MYENLDIYAKADADPDVLANLGPLAPLAGIWEGDAGIDISPSAGGTATADATEFELFADVGSELYGVTSNPYLGRTKRTIRYELKVTIHPDGRFSYAEDTQIEIDGRDELFHHTDSNVLIRVG